MKKHSVYLALIFAMIMFLVACGDSAIQEECSDIITFGRTFTSFIGGGFYHGMPMEFSYTDEDGIPVNNAEFSVSATGGWLNMCIGEEHRSEPFPELKNISGIHKYNVQTTPVHDYIFWTCEGEDYYTLQDGKYTYNENSEHYCYDGGDVYIKTIIRVDGNIVAYSVGKLYAFDPPLPEGWENWGRSKEEIVAEQRYYIPLAVKSVRFPKIDGGYQNISEEYVINEMNKAQKSAANLIPRWWLEQQKENNSQKAN